MSNTDDCNLIRKALIDELEAINGYEDFMQHLEDRQAIQTMGHINTEEKEHVAELMALLRRLDPAQAQKLEQELKG